MKPRYWHYWISLALCAALAPVLLSQHLPLRFAWKTLAIAYWIVLATESIFLAGILCLIGLPREQVWDPLAARYRQNPLRIAFLLCYFGVLVWATTWMTAFVLTGATVAVLELYEGRKTPGIQRTLTAAFPAAGYFFLGFLMVLAYNCAIVSARFNLASDPALAAIDRWLMHGYSIWDLTRWAVKTFPLQFFQFMEFIYFGMFPQIGAAILLLAACEGRARALQFIGTILLAYYFALAIFFLVPAQGPYYLHPSCLPPSLRCYTVQTTLVSRALALQQHVPISRISTDYFIEMPCMHIVQPIIVLWFLRLWRRMFIALAVYDAVLVLAILVLEMHYAIDLLVGALVAAAAIAITAGRFRGNATPNVPLPSGAGG